MNRIRFSHYYHKLRHPLWCMVRTWNPDKATFYLRLVGKPFEVFVGSALAPKGTATLLSMETLPGIGRLPTDFIDFDTAYTGGAYPLPTDKPLLLLFFLWEWGEVPEGLA